MDRFSRVCLALVVLLLAASLTRPFFSPKPVHVAQSRHEVLDYSKSSVPLADDFSTNMQKAINGEAAKGWERVAVTPITGSVWTTFPVGYSTLTKDVLLIFRRP
jgi:energy-converting hydrogenase Eha subunit F